MLRALGATIPADEVALSFQPTAGFPNPRAERLAIRMADERRSRARLTPVRELSIGHLGDGSEWIEKRWAGPESRSHLRGVLWREAERTVLVDLIRAAPVESFGMQDVLRLRQILPGLSLALRASIDCAPSALATDSFHRLPFGLALLDPGHRILFQNGAMRSVLARRDALVAENGILCVQDETGQDDLARVVRQALDAEPLRGERVVFRRTCGRSPYLATVERFDGGLLAGASRREPLIRLTLSDPDHSNAAAITRVAEHYRLTQGETEVAQAMLLGMNVLDCATQLDLSVNTVRWHQKNIFAKTGTCGRPELILLFLRGARLHGG